MLAAPDDGISFTFRYTLATMPLLLYVVFWSINCITDFSGQLRFLKMSAQCANAFFILVAIFAIGYANMMTADGIVGPQDSDYRFIESQLSEKVIPLVQQNKLVALHVIDCDHGINYPFQKGIPEAFEYGMRLCSYPHHLVGGVSHSMMALGYLSNRHKQNDVFSDGKLFVLKNVPWGNMIVSSDKDYDMSHLDYPADEMTLVTVDMRDAPLYQRFGLYKRLLGMKEV